MNERIGLFGGTFDPIHTAHLRLAQAALEQCGLARILFIPAGDPPHRVHGAFASYEDRFRMVEIACAPFPRFEPSRLEDRPGKTYTVETVERFRQTLPPGQSIYWLIGADAFAEIRTWFRWRDLLTMVSFAVVGRPGAAYDPPAEAEVERVTGVDLPISSSDIRAELAAGDAHLDVPGDVVRYIRQRRLYAAS